MHKFNVEIQADDKSWFVAHNGEGLAAEAADAMIVTLRAEGFKARATLVQKD